MAFPETVPALNAALVARGYNDPTPVQEAVLDPNLSERDLLVSAQTGSGKTVAFGLAMAPSLMAPSASTLLASGAPLALIIAPTRELALQVEKELQWLYAGLGARITSCIGGTDARREARQLTAGAHIVVGTPGRLCDHLSRGSLQLSNVKVVVLDEADEMLDLGFREELEQLLNAAPQERRTLLFSATIAREIATLARRFQKKAERIDVVSATPQHADITYRCILTAQNEIGRAVVNVLRFYESPTALLFCHTRAMVAQVQAALLERGFASVAISGEMGQNERSRAIEALRSGVARVCVATDVAARGLDIPALDLVIHANIPSEAETLLHRSGRTGRAGRKGTSILMVPATQRRKAERLLVQARIKDAHWEAVPSPEKIRERDAARLLENVHLFTPNDGAPSSLVTRLVEAYDASQLAHALEKLYEKRLPKVENTRTLDVTSSALPVERTPRREREGRSHVSVDGGTWFSLNVGRSKNADPKWLIPLICRQGGVTKKEIGTIRINSHLTLFEIDRGAAERFAASIAKARDEEVQIRPAASPGATAPTSRKPYKAAPAHERSTRKAKQRKRPS